MAALACAVVAAIAPVRATRAQVAASVTLVSEYSARGVSLSEGRPALQARIDADSASGWYAGAFASRVALPDSDASLQLIAYGGYAKRLPSGLSWEAGALGATFPGGGQYRYHELYAGLAGDRVAGRVYFSPSYYGGGKTVYAELNASYQLRERLTLLGHAGLLHPFGNGEDEARNRIDLRIALGLDVGGCNLQFALVAGAPGRHRREAARALAVSATHAF